MIDPEYFQKIVLELGAPELNDIEYPRPYHPCEHCKEGEVRHLVSRELGMIALRIENQRPSEETECGHDAVPVYGNSSNCKGQLMHFYLASALRAGIPCEKNMENSPICWIFNAARGIVKVSPLKKYSAIFI